MDETINSDIVAYLNDRKLLCEHNPRQLMQSYSKTSLEDVIYLICKIKTEPETNELKNKSENNVLSLPPMDKLTQSGDRWANPIKEKLLSNIDKEWIVLRRTCKLYISEYINMLALTVFPLITTFMFTLQYWKLPDRIPVGVFNTDTQFNNISLADELLQAISSNGQTVLV